MSTSRLPGSPNSRTVFGQRRRPTLLLLALLLLLAGPRATAGQPATPAQPAAAQEQEQLYIGQIATSSALPDIIFVTRTSATPPNYIKWHDPVYSINGGATWQRFPANPWAGLDIRRMRLGIAPQDDGTPRFIVTVTYWDDAIGSSAGKIFKSGDYGQSWEVDDAGAGTQIWDFVVSPSNARRLYHTRFSCPSSCLTELYSSDNGGADWIHTSTITPAARIVVSPVLPDRVYANINASTQWLRSDALGSDGSWVEQMMPSTILVLNSQNPALMYSYANAYTSEQYGITSEDGGQTWRPWVNPPSQTASMIPHPTKSGVLYLRSTNPLGLFRTTDAGLTWQQLTTEAGELLGVDHGNGRLLWAYNGCLSASTDDGDTWTPLGACIDQLNQVFLPAVAQESAVTQTQALQLALPAGRRDGGR